MQARAGEISNMTGIGSPYEAPVNPEIVLSAEGCSVDHCVENLLCFLRDGGYLQAPETETAHETPSATPPADC